MSLYVSLNVKEPIKVTASSGIFIRENGKTKEISELEWYERFPDKAPVVLSNEDKETTEVFSYNITHNLGQMASAAGLYLAMWRPEDIGASKATDLIIPLSIGLKRLLDDPEQYKTYNPENGWGNYEGLVEFAKQYLTACTNYPQAEIYVSR